MSIDKIFQGQLSDEKTFLAEIRNSRLDADLVESYLRDINGKKVEYIKNERDGYTIWHLKTKSGSVECRVPHKPVSDFMDDEDYVLPKQIMDRAEHQKIYLK